MLRRVVQFIAVFAAVASSVAASGASTIYYPGQAGFGHQTGRACGNLAWCCIVTDPTNVFMTYGPYFTGYAPGRTMMLSFSLAVDNNTNDELPIAIVNVAGHDGSAVYATRTVIRSDFLNVAATPCYTTAWCYPRTITLLFETPTDGAALEFRVFYLGRSALTHYSTVLSEVTDPTETGRFWSDTAHFAPVSYLAFPTAGQPASSASANVGQYFVSVAPDRLYLFHREFYFAPTPAGCPPVYARIVVRESRNGGVTFSAPVVIATPQPGTATECGLVDGSAHYDASTNTWYYLSQCIATDSVWNMCLFTLANSASPMSGSWAASPSNPVVRSGQLWATICCASRPCHCTAGTMGEEGTPDIVGKDADGFFYVTFHGWDPTHVKSARGVARTLDFVTWQTRGPRLAGDAIFSTVDCSGWNVQWASGGCVGGGEGSIVRSGGYMYQIIEAPDISLGCLVTPGQQNWVLGLLRAPDLEFLPTGNWQQFRVAPVVVPAQKQGCFLQYQRLFIHNNTLHFGFWGGVNTGSYHLHRLEAGAAALPIVATLVPPSS